MRTRWGGCLTAIPLFVGKYSSICPGHHTGEVEAERVLIATTGVYVVPYNLKWSSERLGSGRSCSSSRICQRRITPRRRTEWCRREPRPPKCAGLARQMGDEARDDLSSMSQTRNPRSLSHRQ